MNPILGSWITSGEPTGISAPVPLEGTDQASREESVRSRCQEMIATLKGMQSGSKVTMTTLLQAPRGVDLLDESIAEIEKISKAKAPESSVPPAIP